MRREIRIAGFGGQGVVTMGTILAVAAGIYEELEVAQTQSYGPEARGGACRSDVIISDEPIDYTKPLALDVFIGLSQAAMERYGSEIEERTIVMVDRTLVGQTPIPTARVLGIEATRIAEEDFKDRMVANMILLGAMGACTGWIRLKAMEQALKGRIPEKNLEASTAALRRGFEVGHEMMNSGTRTQESE